MDSFPPDDEPRERPLTFVAAALWTLLVVLLLGVATWTLEAVHPGARYDLVTFTACKLLAYSVVFFAILRIHAPEASIRQVLAVRRPPISLAVLGAVVGAGLSPIAQWVSARATERFPPSPEDAQALDRMFGTESSGKKIALVLSLVVLTPIFDELFFRGALYTPLKRGRRAEAVVLATAAYDVLMAAPPPPQLLWLLPTLLAFAWMRAVTGSVLPALFARIAFFGVEVVPMVLRGESKVSLGIAAGGAAASVVALAAIAAIGRRSARVLDARLEDG
ncbi:MAG: CPBP family intramembrane metalloprotease [Deltaproteobacteria bacterium]|nr:CPBP family intramembrane metalloprotease [Deltaproteobacteria bacterium]